MNYETAKLKEEKVVEYYENKFKEIDKGAKKIAYNQYDYADLVMQDSSGGLHCMEVKYRAYTKEYMLKNGVIVDLFKLKNIQRTYGVSSFTLITLTSDGYYFKSLITDNCFVTNILAPEKSCFGERVYIDKQFLVTYNHQEVGYASTLDIKYKPMTDEQFFGESVWKIIQERRLKTNN